MFLTCAWIVGVGTTAIPAWGLRVARANDKQNNNTISFLVLKQALTGLLHQTEYNKVPSRAAVTSFVKRAITRQAASCWYSACDNSAKETMKVNNNLKCP